jgi:16S rRNA (guanine966-N2)-methyltransferase
LRVTAGRFKGHKLAAFSAAHLRPTTDRIKESIFNRLGPYLEGARVLDLFSGTGALSIEAVSRGAGTVVAVENHPGSLKIMRQNFTKLKIEAEIKVMPIDVFRYLKDYAGPAFEIILIDPPFTKELADSVLEAVASSPVIGADSRLFIESGRREMVKDEYSPLKLKDQRDYGDKFVSFFTCP